MDITITYDHESTVMQMISDGMFGIVPFEDMKKQVEDYCKHWDVPVSTLQVWINNASKWK